MKYTIDNIWNYLEDGNYILECDKQNDRRFVLAKIILVKDKMIKWHNCDPYRCNWDKEDIKRFNHTSSYFNMYIIKDLKSLDKIIKLRMIK